MSKPSREDRIVGCLLAGALGDAIGSHFESKPPPSEFTIPRDLRVSDDTQLTLATCESIIEAHVVDPARIANQFVRWFRARRITGIGASTLKALTELDVGGHWAMVGATGEYSAGNGAAMRIAPLAFCLNPDVDSDRLIIRDVCRITHRNDEAYIGAIAVIRTMRHVIEGHQLSVGFLALLVDAIPDSRVRDRLISIQETSISVAEYGARFGSSGFVVDSVPLAIVAAIETTDMLETVKQIVHCGGDTDTISSMFGQIYGAAFGAKALPMEIIDRIEEATLVRETASKFSRTIIAR